ncbi:MAG: ABC transporter permease [Bacillaceae bacterium]|nr:ABC transporter permease [Bacillaceae bacterium]
MLKYTLKRFVYMVMTLFVIASITFFLMKLLPGGPYQNPERITPEVKAAFDAKYGLDDPIPVQYVNFIKNLLQGDLGMSFKYANRQVTDIIADTFPNSALIGFEAVIFGTVFGLLFGIIAALKRGSFIDYSVIIIATIGVAVPSFVLGAILQYVFGVQLKILPVATWGSFAHTVLPSLTLGALVVATIARLMRTSMLDVLSSDFLKTAKSKGLNTGTIIWRHAIRNALIPVVTILATLTMALITGSLVVERIFAVPGMGDYFVTTIYTNDYTLTMGITLFYSALYIFSIFLTDVAYGLIDPRIRVAGRKE